MKHTKYNLLKVMKIKPANANLPDLIRPTRWPMGNTYNAQFSLFIVCNYVLMQAGSHEHFFSFPGGGPPGRGEDAGHRRRER